MDKKAATLNILKIRGEIIKHLPEYLTKERMAHTFNVEKTAIRLSKIYGASYKKIVISSLLHDIARDLNKENLFKLIKKWDIKVTKIEKENPDLLHAKVGRFIAKYDFKIKDRSILKAIEEHTVASASMSLLSKILFISDFIEEGRSFKGVKKIRNLALKDLDLAIILALENTICYVLKQKKLLDLKTVSVRNYFLVKTALDKEA